MQIHSDAVHIEFLDSPPFVSVGPLVGVAVRNFLCSNSPGRSARLFLACILPVDFVDPAAAVDH